MKKKHTVLILVLLLLLAAAFGVIKVKSSIESNLEQVVNLSISDVDLTKVEDGVYKGSYKVFPVAAEVKVTIKNHKMYGIELIKHDNGQGAGAEILPDKVVEAQTLDVDVVSGATYSSKVILKAIENALNSVGK